MKRIATLLCLATILIAQAPTREKMPGFRARGIDGHDLSNESLAGKPALIQLWATWCGYCRRDQPIVEKLSQEFKGLTIVAINVGESRKKVEAYLKENPRPGVKMVLNEDSNLPALIAPQGFPFYLLLDKDGRVAGLQAGSGGEPSLRDLLSKVGLAKN